MFELSEDEINRLVSQFVIPESADLNRRIDSLESRYDEQFQSVFAAIRQLLDKKSEPRRAIGYRIPEKK
jgi:DnaJ-domain-containing protein 1